jgi:hypothetical protein
MSQPNSIKLPWFGAFHGMKVFGVVFLSLFGLLPWYMFGDAVLWWSCAVWLMMATAFLDGVTVVDVANAKLRRTIRFLWLFPLWSRTVDLRSGGELHLTFKPSWMDRWNKWHIRLDLKYDSGEWLQLMQIDRSKGNFEPSLLAHAQQLAHIMNLPLILAVERRPGDVEYQDRSSADPP